MPAALVRIGREGTGVRTFFSGHTSIGQYPILRYGNRGPEATLSAAHRSRGDMILAFGLTEPDAGSNPLEMTSTYRRDGDRFLLNGVKYLISNGGIANAVIVFAYPADKTGTERRHERVHRRHGRRYVRDAKTCLPSSACSRPTPACSDDRSSGAASRICWAKKETAFASRWERWSPGG